MANGQLFRERQFLLPIALSVAAILIFAFYVMLGSSGSRGVAQNQAVAEDYERGPNKGRLLRSGDFAVEITVFEDGVDPQFRIFPYWRDKPLDPKDVRLAIALTRLGGKVDNFEFVPKETFLTSDGIVKEPHSFDVAVNANYRGEPYSWTYASYEGRTTITAAAAETGGLKTAPVSEASIDQTLDLPGRIVLRPNARAEIRAPYAGRILEMTKAVGDSVRQGELLMRVEASDNLRIYQIMAPMSGVILERNANVGDLTNQTNYVIANPTKLQVVFFAFPRDAERLRAGQHVEIRGLGENKVTSVIKILQSSADPTTQTVAVYADIENPEGVWRAGMAVEGVVTVASTKVPLAVRTRALQRFRNFTVVFAKVENTYEVRMLKLGKKSPDWAEVLDGIQPGEIYVTDNAFLIRADIEKSGAAHDH
jgi:cobalt-zinc-cadmium efflux system membrane fusion protein